MILSLSNSDVWIFCRLTYSIEHSVVEAIDESEISVHIDFFFLPHLLSTRGRAEREVCLPSHRSTADCGEGASAGGSELSGEIPGRSFQEIWKNEGGVGGLSKGESLLSCSEESWEGACVMVNMGHLFVSRHKSALLHCPALCTAGMPTVLSFSLRKSSLFLYPTVQLQ